MASSSDSIDTFPLLELPLLARNEFFQQAKLNDLFAFSLISHDCAEQVKDAGSSVEPFELRINNQEFRFTFWEVFSLVRFCANCIKTIDNRSEYELHPERIILNSETFDCLHYDNSQRFIDTVYAPEIKLKAFHSTVKHVRSVFGANIGFIDLQATGFEDNDIWSSLPSCVHACITGIISDETMTGFLENCKIRGRLQITGFCATLSNHFDRLREIDQLVIQSDALWFTLDHLRRVNCRHFIVENTSVTSEDLRQFITEWKDGKDQIHQSLSLKSRHFDRNIISEGPWRSLAEMHQNLIPDNQMTHELQITRSTDSSKMTVTATDTTVTFAFLYA